MFKIPAVWMRGGTSKCWVFEWDNLQVPGKSVDEVLLRLFAGEADRFSVQDDQGSTCINERGRNFTPIEAHLLHRFTGGEQFPGSSPGWVQESHSDRQAGERNAGNHLGTWILKPAVRRRNLLQNELIGVGVQRPD